MNIVYLVTACLDGNIAVKTRQGRVIFATMDNMRIGIFDPYLDTMSGGEKYMLTAALCLAKQHDVSLFWNTDDERSIRDKAAQRFDFDLSSLTFAPNIFAKDVSFFQRFKQSRTYDAIFLLSDGSLPYLSCPVYLHFQSPAEWVKSSTIKTMLKKARVAVFICNSNYTKSFIDKKFGVNSQVVYPPVSIPELRKRKKENVILHVGRFGITGQGSSFKKQDVLAEVFKEMLDGGLKDWRLVFVTSVMEAEVGKLTEFTQKYTGLPIDFVVNPANEKLWEEYQKAKIYWHASGFGEDLEQYPDRAEHFGISTVEAMGAGAVPVVINAGGQPEIVTNGEDGFLWKDIPELISQTKLLISHPDRLETMGNHAREKAKQFSQESFCQSLTHIIR